MSLIFFEFEDGVVGTDTSRFSFSANLDNKGELFIKRLTRLVVLAEPKII